MPAAKNSWFKFANAADGNSASLVIEGDIGGWGVSAREFRQSFARLGAEEALDIYIMSGGGSIFEGNEIANIIAAHKGEVTVTLGSICASIATVIACSGDKVIASRNTLYMIHNPSVYAEGDADEMRKLAKIMDKMKAGIVKAYAKKTGMTEETLCELMDAGDFMDAEESLSFGFVDSILEEDAEDEVVDNVDLSRYRNCGKLLSRLQTTAPTGEASSGNARMTLANIRNSVQSPPLKPETKQPPTPVTNPTNLMTEAELAVQKAANEKAIADGIKTAQAAAKARAIEIRATVKQELARTGIDFTAEAETFLDTDKPASEFFGVILASTKKPQKSIGSGIEDVVEPLDRLKGTPGFHFVNSNQGKALFDAWNNRGRHSFNATLLVPADFRNATQTSTSPNTLTSIEYKPGVTALGVRVLRIKACIPGGATNATTIRGRREDAFTDDAAAVLETGALANVAVSVAEVDYPVKDLGGYLEMSENLMADYVAVASFINVRLPYKVERVTDYQLLNGDGIGANLTGILSTAGIQTQAKAGDTGIDAIHRAKTKVETVPNGVQANAGGGYSPDLVIVNPTDWETFRLSKDANSQYYGGGPFGGAYGTGEYSNVGVLWGLPCIRTTAIAAGTALVGAFAECAQWFQRQGLVIEMTNSNGTNFINRIVTLRAAERLALTVDLPHGFCQVTGL